MVATEESLRTKVASELDKTVSLESGILSLRSDQEGRTQNLTPEKGPADGYSWRKYGQKHVKGNKFVRSYYRCTYRDCQVKKQVERSHDGQITDTLLFGDHDHPRTQLSLPDTVSCTVVPKEGVIDVPCTVISGEKNPMAAHQPAKPADQITMPIPLTVVVPDRKEHVVSQLTKTKDNVGKDGTPDSKRQKKEQRQPEEVIADRPTMDTRNVQQIVSEVDMVNDGYRWRKYGQKFVKGNPNPRSYYRCSTSGCPVKKHVERASHDAKLVITTYERQHDHEMPPARMMSNSTSGNSANQLLALEYNPSVTPDVVNGSRHDYKEKEQLSGESMIKSEEVEKVGISKPGSNSSSGPECRVSDQPNGNSTNNAEAVESSALTDVIMATNPSKGLNTNGEEITKESESSAPSVASLTTGAYKDLRTESDNKPGTRDSEDANLDHSSPSSRSLEEPNA